MAKSQFKSEKPTVFKRFIQSVNNITGNRLLEAMVPAGILPGDDDPKAAQYRRLSATVRDLLPIQYASAQRMSFYLWQRNPFAHRLIQILIDFMCGDEFAVKIKIKTKGPDGEITDTKKTDAQGIWDVFWKYPINNLHEDFPQFIQDLLINGELILPATVNLREVQGGKVGNGKVRLGYIDPMNVYEVFPNPINVREIQAIKCRPMLSSSAAEEVTFKVARIDTDPESPTFEHWIGDTFYFRFNKVVNQLRGHPFLLDLADWLDALDQLLFDALEGVRLRNSFFYDLELKGLSEEQIKEKIKGITVPANGAVRAHNENAVYNVVTPDLKAADLDKTLQSFGTFIVGSKGFPWHWFGSGENTNRACHDMETQTLTEDGWKCFDEIAPQEKIATFNPENGRVEYQVPTKAYCYEYTGNMLHFKNKKVDILVTPDHRMYGKRARNASESEAYEIIQAQDMRSNAWKIRTAGSWEGVEQKTFTLPGIGTGIGRAVYPAVEAEMDLWLEFLGYFISEGHARAKTGEYVVNLCQKKERGVLKIRKCLGSLPIEFTESTDEEGTVRWVVNDKALNLWLRENCGDLAAGKRLPEFVHGLSSRQLRILFDALMEGDGSIDPRDGHTGMCYYTTSRQLADEVQVLCLKLGMRAKVMFSPGARCFRVQIHPNDEVGIYPSTITDEPYCGKVYCFEVPNHLFLTRRHGKVAVTHNTAAEMGIPTMKMLRAVQNTVRRLVKTMAVFALDMAQQAGEIKLSPEEYIDVEVSMYDFEKRDSSDLSQAFVQIVQGLMLAVTKGWVSQETAKKVMDGFITRLGVEVDADETIEENLAEMKTAELDDTTGLYNKGVQRPPGPLDMKRGGDGGGDIGNLKSSKRLRTF